MRLFMRLKDGMRHERCIGYARPEDKSFAFDVSGKNEQIEMFPSMIELKDMINQLQMLQATFEKEGISKC